MAEDKDLRRARDRFGSLKTHLALNEAIADVPGATPFDSKRIIAQLGERLGEFKHIEGFKECRAAFIVWAVRQARLAGLFRAILPELNVPDQQHIASFVLLRLPDYQGGEDRDTLKSWAVETANAQAVHVSALTDIVTEHRAPVREGIREFLSGCVGLGLDSRIGPVDGDARSTYLVDDGPWSLTVDEIESDVWMDVLRDIEGVLASKAPMAALLNRRGYWKARSWKTNRLRERKSLDMRYGIGLDGVEMLRTNEEGETERSDAAHGFPQATGEGS